MAQQYGLGRGLASLIPPKAPARNTNGDEATHKTVLASGVLETRPEKIPPSAVT